MAKFGRDGRVPKRLYEVKPHPGMRFVEAVDGLGLVKVTGISKTQLGRMTQSGGIPVTQATVEKRLYAEGQPKPHPSHAGPRRHGTAMQRDGIASAVLNDAVLSTPGRRA